VLTVPRGVRRRDIDAFLAKQSGWIARQMARLPERVRLEPGISFPYRGEELRIAHNPAHARRPALYDGEIRLGGPAEQVEARLVRWLKGEARRRLEERAAAHADALDVAVAGVSVRDTKSRWGSCSNQGRLNFSWRLILAPDAVLDYVVAHEVAHLREMNHSAHFWALVEELVGDSECERTWLKVHGSGLVLIGPPKDEFR